VDGVRYRGAVTASPPHDGRSAALQAFLEAHPLRDEVTDRRRARIAEVALRRLSSVTVVMENVADPHNASAVLRTAEGLGVAQLHVVEQPNKWEKNRSITRGADRWVEVVKHKGLARCLGDLSAQGFQLLAADVGEGCVPVHEIDVSRPTALVFGTEHAGLSKRAIALTDGRFTVPMVGFVESFNVSVSAAITLFDVTRRRRAQLGVDGDLPADELQRVANRMLERSVRNPRVIHLLTKRAAAESSST
jgi:tRNA (guanosine-2'-O-)-methyltransferase